MESLRIIFMGTPEFAVPTLDALAQSKHRLVAVVTVPDKPAGRGRQLSPSPVKKYALEHHLPLLQPTKLKNENFLDELRSFDADLFIVVAFRMLPREVWSMPRLGTFNLHASLLPQYRGAAPINWAVINGETLTGLTTFFINEEIDTGKILFREEVPIPHNASAGDLHDQMMEQGARLVSKTADALATGSVTPELQEQLIPGETILKPAPKLFREHCLLNWFKPGEEIYNLVRGLSPYPGAYTLIRVGDEPRVLKIFEVEWIPSIENVPVGTLIIEPSPALKIAVKDGFIRLLSLQMEGKKRMSAAEFLRGLQPDIALSLILHETNES